MKTKTVLFSFIYFMIYASFYSCGPVEPDFQYIDNTRIIIEAKLVDENNTAIANQVVELYSNSFLIQTVQSNNEGKLFLSVPLANRNYNLSFEGKRIISTEHYSSLIGYNSETNQNSGTLNSLKNNYYDFGTIVLTTN